METWGADGERSDRPRLLIPITILFGVRYVIRTGLIDRIRQYADPIVGLSWDDPDLTKELIGAGIETVRLPDPIVSAPARAEFHKLEVAFARRLQSPSTSIGRSLRNYGRPRRARLRRWLAWQRAQLRDRGPNAEAKAADRLQACLATATNIDENIAFLSAHSIEALLSVTPFAAQEQVLLLAAERAGLTTCTSILSFDNITTRAPQPIIFGHYLVWNRFNRDEILRSMPGVSPDQVTMVGPAQFDFYSDPTMVGKESEWREGLGLDPGARTALYGAGASFIAPHETQHVDDLCAAIERGDLPSDLRIVLRRHPIDEPERWERFHSSPYVVFDDPGQLGQATFRPGDVDLDHAQVHGLCTSLAHTDVHLSVSSTMSIDGSFFDKPQIAPAYDHLPGRAFNRLASDLYRREHFIPIVESGGIDLVTSPTHMVEAVNRHLAEPQLAHAARQQMLEELCTFTDGRCTDRVAAELGRFLASQQPTAAP